MSAPADRTVVPLRASSANGTAPSDPVELLDAVARRVADLLAESQRPFLDARSAARLLGLPSGEWLLAEARANRVPHVRFGKYVRFQRDDLLDWAARRVRGPRTGALPVSDGRGGR